MGGQSQSESDKMGRILSDFGDAVWDCPRNRMEMGRFRSILGMGAELTIAVCLCREGSERSHLCVPSPSVYAEDFSA